MPWEGRRALLRSVRAGDVGGGRTASVVASVAVTLIAALLIKVRVSSTASSRQRKLEDFEQRDGARRLAARDALQRAFAGTWSRARETRDARPITRPPRARTGRFDLAERSFGRTDRRHGARARSPSTREWPTRCPCWGYRESRFPARWLRPRSFALPARRTGASATVTLELVRRQREESRTRAMETGEERLERSHDTGGQAARREEDGAAHAYDTEARVPRESLKLGARPEPRSPPRGGAEPAAHASLCSPYTVATELAERGDRPARAREPVREPRGGVWHEAEHCHGDDGVEGGVLERQCVGSTVSEGHVDTPRSGARAGGVQHLRIAVERRDDPAARGRLDRICAVPRPDVEDRLPRSEPRRSKTALVSTRSVMLPSVVARHFA